MKDFWRRFWFCTYLLIAGILSACNNSTPTVSPMPASPVITQTLPPTAIPPVVTPPTPTLPPAPSPTPRNRQMLADGTFDVPASFTFNEPGFHFPIILTHTVPINLPPTAGKQLIISLRDQSSPTKVCADDTPSAGCATVDWQDDPSRPNVPATGIFDNSLHLQIGETRQIWVLNPDSTLTTEASQTITQYSAVGGQSKEWQVSLTDDIMPNSTLNLHLVMSKLRGLQTRIAYEIYVVE